MMNLVPEFIVQKFNAGVMNGKFEGAVLFLDISGFTPMTEALAEFGKEGAEILSEMLNRIFTPAINVIYANGGFISDFAGDAFTAVFTGNACEIRAAVSAFEIQDVFNSEGLQSTKYGEFRFHAKCGLASGEIDWGIVKGKERCLYYFRGDVFYLCAAAERECEEGSVTANVGFVKKLPESCSADKLNESFARITPFKMNIRENWIFKIKSAQEEIISKFHSKELLSMELTGEFREVASVFINFDDIIGLEELHSFLSEVLDCAAKFGGYPTRIIFGDKERMILVLFGAPKTYEDFIQRAIDFLIEINEKGSAKIRAGINLGTVYAGMVGSAERCEYTVYGDTVNLAARFMSKAGKSEVWASEGVMTSAMHTHRFADMGERKFKGKSELHRVYKLLNRKSNIQKRWELKRSSYVGRNKELEILKAKYSRISADLNRKEVYKTGYKQPLVLIKGDAGMGKTRLIDEFKKATEIENSILSGATPGVLQSPYCLIISLIRDYLGVSPAEHLNVLKHKLEKCFESLQAVVDEDLKQNLQESLPLIGALLNINYEDIRLKLDPKELIPHIQNSIRFFIESVAIKTNRKSKPLIIVMEDLQWVDEASLLMLKHLLFTVNIDEKRSGRPLKQLLFIVATRPEFEVPAEFSIDADLEEIFLFPIDKNSTEELISSMTGEWDIPETVKEKLMERSAGNPFYIEEWVSLVNDLPDAGELKEFPVPSSLNALVLARIDSLEKPLRTLLQQASVIGKEFFVKILVALNRVLGTETVLKDPLNELEADEFILEMKSAGPSGYLFKHVVTRDVAYNTILTSKKKIFHRIVAESIENEFPDNLNEFVYDLAEHYTKAEVRDKSVEYLEKAGNAAKEGFENKKALTYYDELLRLLENSDETERLIKILFRKAEVLDVTGDWNQCEQIMNRIHSHAEMINDFRSIADARCRMGNLMVKLSRYDEALKYCDLAEAYYQETGNLKGLSNINIYRGSVSYGRGDYSTAMEFYQKSLSGFGAEGEQRIHTVIAGSIGAIYYMKYDFEMAMKYYRKQLKLALKNGYMDIVATATAYIGNIHMYAGRHNRAMAVMRIALKKSEEIGKKPGIMSITGNMGILSYKMGDYDTAMTHFRKLKDMAHQLGLEKSVAVAEGNMGNVYSETGRFSEALQCFKNCHKYFEQIGYRNGVLESLESTGIAHFYSGEYEKSLIALDKAISLAREIEIFEEIYVTEIWIANAYFMMGKLEDAEKHCLEGLKSVDDSEKLRARILIEKIKFASGDKTGPQKELEKLLNEVKKGTEEEASILYEIWKIDEKKDKMREQAFLKYSNLFKKTPRHKYTEKIRELEK